MVIVAVLTVGAGILGLFVDGIRHMLESGCERLSQRFHKRTIYFAWPEVTSEEADNNGI